MVERSLNVIRDIAFVQLHFFLSRAALADTWRGGKKTHRTNKREGARKRPFFHFHRPLAGQTILGGCFFFVVFFFFFLLSFCRRML